MKHLRLHSLCAVAVLACASSVVCQTATAPIPPDLKFDFSSGPVLAGYTRVSANSLYSDAAGFGYEPGAQVSPGDGGKTTSSDKPFFFSAKVPEGNYTVTLSFGDSATATTTTVKAESGRLMLERVEASAGQVLTRTFTTNVRTPHLPKLPLNATGREEVSLDQFDSGNTRDWDDKLTVEIVSPHAALRSIEIASAPTAPTVFLAGDSTMTDRDGGGDVSWGQILPVFFKPGIAVSNQAQSGETMKSFMNALRLDKILSQMKKGDFLFLQFAHNDSKASWPQTYVEPATTYKAYLRVYIAEARLRGATPVLVTAMDRGNRTTGAPSHAHGGYIDAMREVAAEEHVPLIDLYTASIAFYDHVGADAPKILADGTHSTAYGGYEFARVIATGIQQSVPGLAPFLVDNFKPFDPTHPDALAALNLGPLFSSGAGGRGPRPTPPAAPGATPPPAPKNPGLGPL